ncbi:MAG TPA: hypothetical protein VF100_06990, partial [Thermoanaerobaculia bacterium]
MHRSPRPRRAAAAAFLPPLAAGIAFATFAAHQLDPHAAAETAYLALLATALLAALAAVEAAPGRGRRDAGGLGTAAAALAVLAGWALPAGPGRGVAVLALLVGALAVAAGRRLGERGGALLLPLALALQLLVRSDRLLAPEVDGRLLAGLVGLPVVAAAAAAFLAARAGRGPALVAAATAALLGPGFTVLGTGALVALAGGEALWRPRGDSVSRAGERWLGLAALAASALAVAASEPWAAVVVVGAVLATAGRDALAREVVARGRSGGSVEPSGGRERSLPDGAAGRVVGMPSGTAGAGVAATAAVALVVLPPAEGWAAAAAPAFVLVAPLAVVFAVAAVSRRSRAGALAAAASALVALAAARAGAGGAALAAPLAALPLVAGQALAGRPAAERRAWLAPQAVWSAALITAVGLAAAYPWLRSRPLATALDLFAAGRGWAAAGSVAA